MVHGGIQSRDGGCNQLVATSKKSQLALFWASRPVASITIWLQLGLVATSQLRTEQSKPLGRNYPCWHHASRLSIQLCINNRSKTICKLWLTTRFTSSCYMCLFYFFLISFFYTPLFFCYALFVCFVNFFFRMRCMLY